LLNQKENRNKSLCFLTYHLKYVCRESTVFLVKTIFTQCRIATASLKDCEKIIVQKVFQRPNVNFVENLHHNISIQIFIPIPRY
jgi:hypothetical protein